LRTLWRYREGSEGWPGFCPGTLLGLPERRAQGCAVKRRKLRESGAIPRSKVTEALKLDGKKTPQA